MVHRRSCEADQDGFHFTILILISLAIMKLTSLARILQNNETTN
jgi:hypothetical protein